MKFKTIIGNGYMRRELGYDLPRIPVKGELIRFYIGLGAAVEVFTVWNILWDLENGQVVIECE